MIRAWVADVTKLLNREYYEKYYRQLPDSRKKKADALRLDLMKAQSAGVWALWQKIRETCQLPESTAVNFSHSGTYVMCAVCMNSGNIRVGCDIQKMETVRMDVIMRRFCREEYETVKGAATEEEKKDLFFRYWVLKESFMKATGKGMAVPVNSFCIRMGDPPVLVSQPEEFPDAYFYREYRMEEFPYKMAVCSTDPDIDTEIHTELIL